MFNYTSASRDIYRKVKRKKRNYRQVLSLVEDSVFVVLELIANKCASRLRRSSSGSGVVGAVTHSRLSWSAFLSSSSGSGVGGPVTHSKLSCNACLISSSSSRSPSRSIVFSSWRRARRDVGVSLFTCPLVSRRLSSRAFCKLASSWASGSSEDIAIISSATCGTLTLWRASAASFILALSSSAVPSLYPRLYSGFELVCESLCARDVPTPADTGLRRMTSSAKHSGNLPITRNIEYPVISARYTI